MHYLAWRGTNGYHQNGGRKIGKKNLKIGDGCVIAAHALYITFTSDVNINGVHAIITGT